MFESLMAMDAEAVFSLQQYFQRSTIEGMATSCSKLGDPRYAYAVIFPVIFWWAGPSPGGVVLLASSLAEWMNIALKWISQGDRPYWWVGEHPDLWNSSNQLIQVPITCETGPGMPSGHVMISLTALLCCCSYVGGTGGGASAEDNSSKEKVKGKRGVASSEKGGVVLRRRLAQSLVVVFSAVIGLTRVLISSHFIHQVLAGIAVGIYLHHIISKSRVLRHHLQWAMPTSSTPFLILSVLLLLSGLALYSILRLLNSDPAFSVPLAQRHCRDPSWVHLDTTPFYSLVRCSGTLWGMSLVSRSATLGTVAPQWEEGSERDSTTPARATKFACLAASLLAVRVIARGAEAVKGVWLLGSEVLGFYAMALVKAALVPVATMAPLYLLRRAANV